MIQELLQQILMSNKKEVKKNKMLNKMKDSKSQQMITPDVSPIKKKISSRDITESQKKEIKTFLAKLEVGDLCFLDIIPYGIILLGKTKAGKTTLAHYLVKNSLISQNKYDGIYYTTHGQPARMKEAVIGLKSESQTEIPNECITQLIVDNKHVHLLDCPGYGDSKGSFTIITNGYYHYRVFSKIQNLKFVLTFDGNEFKSGVTLQTAYETIKEFFDSFKNLKTIKDKIFDATVFFFTKVEKQDVKSELQNFKSATIIGKLPAYQPLIIELIDKIIKEEKYFIFLKPTRENQKPQNTVTLKDIHQKTKFWNRRINEKQNEVDMSEIQISLGPKLSKVEQAFQVKLQILCQQFTDRFNQAMGSRKKRQLILNLQSVEKIQKIQNVQKVQKIQKQEDSNFKKLQQEQSENINFKAVLNTFLTNSLLGKPEQKSFYQPIIKRFIDNYYIFDLLKEKSNSIFNKKEYEQKRTIIKREKLIYANEKIDKSEIEWIQKLQISKMIFQLLEKHSLDIKDGHGFSRSITFYNQIAHSLLNIISQFRKIHFYKRASPEHQEYINNLQKFIYIIYRLIEQAKIFKMLFSSEKTFDNTVEFARAYDQTTFLIYDMLERILQENGEYMAGNTTKAFDRARVNFITNIFEIKENQSFYYYNQIQAYCRDVDIQLKNEAFVYRMNKVNTTKLSSSNIQLDKNQKINLFVKNIRNSILNLSKNSSSANFQEYIGYMNDLGFQLTKINRLEQERKEQAKKAFSLAIGIYKKVNNIHRVIFTYNELVKMYDEQTEAYELKKILLEGSAFASKHGRREKALQMLEHAYHMIDRVNLAFYQKDYVNRADQRRKIAEMIGFLGLERSYNPAENYYDNLIMKRFCQIIEEKDLLDIELKFPENR